MTRGIGIVWLNNLECGGSEQTLAACTHSSWGSSSNHNDDVGIGCEVSHPNTNANLAKARIVGKSGAVLMGGTYKSVRNCAEYFNAEDSDGECCIRCTAGYIGEYNLCHAPINYCINYSEESDSECKECRQGK